MEKKKEKSLERGVGGNEVKVKLDYLCFVVYYGMMIELS